MEGVITDVLEGPPILLDCGHADGLGLVVDVLEGPPFCLTAAMQMASVWSWTYLRAHPFCWTAAMQTASVWSWTYRRAHQSCLTAARAFSLVRIRWGLGMVDSSSLLRYWPPAKWVMNTLNITRN